MSTQTLNTIALKDHEAAAKYITVTVELKAVLKSWQSSLFAFEWLDKDGNVKSPDELAVQQRQKRLETEEAIQAGKPLPRPVLGVGMLNTVEIGSGKAMLLTAAALGYETLDVHIREADRKDLKSILAK